MIENKGCSVCGEIKPRTEFYSVGAICKICRQAQNRAWYQRNREARDAQVSAYRKANPSVARRASKKFRDAHLLESRERCRAYQKAHHAEINERVKRYKQEHPERVLAWYHTARANMAGVSGSFTEQEWLALLEACGHRCVKCCKHESEIEPRKDRPVILEVDHIIPLSCGGSGHISNIQPLCWRCNNRKRKRIEDHRPADVRARFAEFKAA